MKDEQRVYIRGNSERGSEVIKTLEDLGGHNTLSCTGTNSNNYYFIDPNGVIDTAPPCLVGVFPYVKKFYKEIKLPKWKPEHKGCYYFINVMGDVAVTIWYDIQYDNECYEFGNCFKTIKEAESARDKIKEILNKHK